MDNIITGSLLGTNVCLSGGAVGADLAWGEAAKAAGHVVIHWSFQGHRSDAGDTRFELKEEQLVEADEVLQLANRTLRRNFPPRSPFVLNLLRRNFYQVRWSETVYAISSIERGQVKGGTAWATQMFIDRHRGQHCACYVFDQDANQWYNWQGRWAEINKPPAPEGIYAGIGTRKLNSDGRRAISQVYQ